MSGRVRKIISRFRAYSNSLLAILLVSGLLLLINYYTIEIVSGVRAYIHGESYYSKGQNNACKNLLRYLDNGDELHWSQFLENIEINLGDGKAREILLSDEPSKAGIFLIQGKNHPDDIELMIWLFTTFKDYSFMKVPIEIWSKADKDIDELHGLALDIRSRMESSKMDSTLKKSYQQKIHHLSTKLTDLGILFMDSLSNSGRRISHLLLITNTIFILLIVGGASFITLMSIKKLINSEERLIIKNRDLTQANNELDRFVYSASHDLRAPITSLKGLINVASTETDNQILTSYFKMMNQSLDKQDTFIRKIISFSKNKRSESTVEEFDLDFLIDSILDHFKFMANYELIELRKNINVGEIKADIVRLEIILSNLLSNAIKYSDSSKEKPFLEIEANIVEGKLIINVIDNGIGISASNKDRIFEMFYMTQNNESGSGVGLYIVKETVDKLGGEIHVESEKNIGSKFNLIIPIS